jgi:hypothetical protein
VSGQTIDREKVRDATLDRPLRIPFSVCLLEHHCGWEAHGSKPTSSFDMGIPC